MFLFVSIFMIIFILTFVFVYLKGYLFGIPKMHRELNDITTSTINPSDYTVYTEKDVVNSDGIPIQQIYPKKLPNWCRKWNDRLTDYDSWWNGSRGDFVSSLRIQLRNIYSGKAKESCSKDYLYEMKSSIF